MTADILIQVLDGRKWADASPRSLYPGVKRVHYLSTKTMGGPQDRTGRFGEQKSSCFCKKPNYEFSINHHVA
jgi:hypothetical protein